MYFRNVRLFMRPVYTRCLYRHVLYARVYLRGTRQWPITNARINGWHLFLHSGRIARSRFVPRAPHRLPLRRDILQCFMEIVISIHDRRVTRETAASADRLTAAVEFRLREINGRR